MKQKQNEKTERKDVYGLPPNSIRNTPYTRECTAYGVAWMQSAVQRLNGDTVSLQWWYRVVHNHIRDFMHTHTMPKSCRIDVCTERTDSKNQRFGGTRRQCYTDIHTRELRRNSTYEMAQLAQIPFFWVRLREILLRLLHHLFFRITAAAVATECEWEWMWIVVSMSCSGNLY